MPPDRLTPALVRLADGDRAAFDVVYDLAAPPVLRLCNRMLANAPDAEDAAQQALLEVFERAREYDPELGAAMPWILGVAAWKCRSHRRRSTRRRTPELDCQATPDPETLVSRAEIIARVSEVVGGLSAVDQETLLAAMGHLERADVAPATYRKRLQRALERLKLAWRREHG